MTAKLGYSVLGASALACSVLGGVGVASAQGVFDPGVLTATLGADAVRQSEEGRAGRSTRREAPAERDAFSKLTCSRYPSYTARFGAGDARVRRLYGLCRQAGYPLR